MLALWLFFSLALCTGGLFLLRALAAVDVATWPEPAQAAFLYGGLVLLGLLALVPWVVALWPRPQPESQPDPESTPGMTLDEYREWRAMTDAARGLR